MYKGKSPSSSAEVITRTFKIHRFDPHPRRRMVIVQGDLVISVTSPVSRTVLAQDRREFKKVINLEGLSSGSDREAIIEEILQTCPFIDSSQIPYLSIAIEYVASRKYDEKGLAITTVKHPPSASSILASNFSDYFEYESMLSNEISAEQNLHEAVDMASIDSYVELLYEEDFKLKVRGARLISKLAKISENLVSIASHESALNALFRTLREDYKKSMDLTTYILSVYESYAQFIDFHSLLTSHKVCSITMDIIEFVLLRYKKWNGEIIRRQEILEMETYPSKFRSDFDKLKQKFEELTGKQDALLCTAFNILLLMSESTFLQRKTLSRGIVPMLVSTLERKNLDLISVSVAFLISMSIFSQTKAEMSQLRVTEIIGELINGQIPETITQACLVLLYNLSFDAKTRHKLVKLETVPWLDSFLIDQRFKCNTGRILYLMSMDRRNRLKLAVLKTIPNVLRVLAANQNKLASNLEIAGIAINLSKNKKAANIMCENNGLVYLLQQAFENEDPLVMKIVRNISEHPTARPHFRHFTCDLARALTEATSSQFIVECVGTLSNIDLPNIDYCKMFTEFRLIPWIQSILMKAVNTAILQPQGGQYGNNQQTSSEIGKALLTFEVIVLIGTCARDEDAAIVLIEEGILELLIKILVANEAVLAHSILQQNQLKQQILYVFFRFCCHPESRKYIQEKTRIPKIILDILNSHRHGNGRSLQICEAITDLFGDCDKEWIEKLKLKRFTLHNEGWIDMIERSVERNEGRMCIDSFYSGEPTSPGFGFKNPFGGKDDPGDQDEDDNYDENDDYEDEDYEEDVEEEFTGKTNNWGQSAKSIFNRFQAQYEQETKAKEEWKKEFSEEENDDEESISSPSIENYCNISFPPALRSGGGGGSRGKNQQL